VKLIVVAYSLILGCPVARYAVIDMQTADHTLTLAERRRAPEAPLRCAILLWDLAVAEGARGVTICDELRPGFEARQVLTFS
jgi:hypothetical protein